MTTKILTLRVPTLVYSELCSDAAKLGVSLSAHVRRLLEQEHQAEQISGLRTEILAKLDQMNPAAPRPAAPSRSVLYESNPLLERGSC